MAVERSALDKLKIDREPEPDGHSRLGIALLLFLIAGLLVGAAWFWARQKSGVDVMIATVEMVATSGKQTVLNATGYVEARRNAVVSSKVIGKVTEVLVEEGMKVEQDQVLARLDTTNIDVNRSLALAQLKVSRSSLGETEARLKEARLGLARTQRLAAEKIASAAELDAAIAQVESLEARLARQKEEIGVSESQIKLWDQELADRVIRAPFAGVVISKNAQPGEMISPNSAGGGFTRTGICTLVDMASLEIEVDVNESYINRVREEQPVEATLDAYTEWRIPCRVIAIIPTADRQKATVKVRIGFNELDPRILPDMGVKVAFQGIEQKEAERKGVSLPKAAITSLDGKHFVFVVANGTVERRVIQIEDAADDPTLALAGLAAGEKIVLNAPRALTDGEPVNVKTQ